jgi:hypothetical protein
VSLLVKALARDAHAFVHVSNSMLEVNWIWHRVRVMSEWSCLLTVGDIPKHVPSL